MTPPSWVFLAPGIIPSPGHYPAVWGDCGLSQCRSLQRQGPKEGLVFPERFQDSLIVPKQAILPLIFKTLRRGLSPRTTGRSKKSGDPGLRSGTWTVILGSSARGARGSPGSPGSPGRLLVGEAETTPSYFPDVISWEESKLAVKSRERIPDPCSSVFCVGAGGPWVHTKIRPPWFTALGPQKAWDDL